MTRIRLDEMTSDQLDALYTRLANAERELERLTDMAIRYSDRAIENGARAERAEATLADVRALAERWQHTGDRKNGPLTELRAVLDQHGQTPA
ncbi:hypothetical protein ACFU8I_02770 [Streptomyces sp. NPDC057540]|uniref:hypothetical protein n=1 Tax=Streptomyces sp. NPDC057540 TaxID=3346160 RepID=UPI0036930DEA